MSIREKLTLAFALVGLFPILALVILSYRFNGKQIREDAHRRNSLIANEIANQIESTIEMTLWGIENLATNPDLINDSQARRERLAEIHRIQSGRLTSLSLLDADGRTIESTSPFSQAQDGSPWFQAARDRNHPVVSSPLKTSETGELSLSIYLPVSKAPAGDTRVIRASFPFAVIRNSVSGLERNSDSFMALLDGQGNVLFSNLAVEPLKRLNQKLPSDYWNENPSGTYRMPSNGRDYEFVSLEVNPGFQLDSSQSWRLVWFEDRKNVLALLHQHSLNHFVAATFGLTFAIALGFWAGAHLSSPLQGLYRAVLRVAKGDLDVRLPEQSGSIETNAVAASFNNMMAQLKETQDSLGWALEEQKGHRQMAESLTTQMAASYEAVQHGLLLTDSRDRIVLANSALLEAFGMGDMFLSEQEVGILLDEVVKRCDPPEEFRKLIDEIFEDPKSVCDVEFAFQMDKTRTFSVFTAPVFRGERQGPEGRVWIFCDLTEQRQLQEQLQQSQKMEAVGRLAGGIAHDFNNLLTSISGNLALAEHGLSDLGIPAVKLSQVNEHVHTAQRSASRASSLVSQLLGYSRSSAIKLEKVDLNSIVWDTEEILRYTLEPNVDLDLDCDEDLWLVEADVIQVQQVLLNLCVNASDAISGKGSIRVRTRNATWEKNDRPSDRMNYVCLEVEDDGVGMNQSDCDKVFEPFFTTKEQGKGTGLGLPMCLGIVEQHGGWIEVESQEGVGTTVSIYLPRSNGGKVAKRKAKKRGDSSPAQATFTAAQEKGTILVVDDEPSVRIVAESVLKRNGFQVITACNGKEAVELSLKMGDEIQLIVMDFTMPVMCGREAFQLMARDFPDRPVIICSGYITEVEDFRTEDGIAPCEFIQKPYSLEAFVEIVFRILESNQLEQDEEAIGLPS